MQLNGVRQRRCFEVMSNVHHLRDRDPMIYRANLLDNYRTLIQVWRDVVRRSTNDLNTSRMGLMIGSSALKTGSSLHKPYG